MPELGEYLLMHDALRKVRRANSDSHQPFCYLTVLFCSSRPNDAAAAMIAP